MSNTNSGKGSKKKDFDALKQAEEEITGKEFSDDNSEEITQKQKVQPKSIGESPSQEVEDLEIKEEQPKKPSFTLSGTLSNEPPTNGYYKINSAYLPQGGILYPESWEFAYRCPTASEVSNFSTVQENDQAGIVQVIEDLIKKCVIIYDSSEDKQISANEILDGHRTFFLLLLRNIYLPGQPLKYGAVCNYCHDSFDAILAADKLKYFEINEELLKYYDGRIFRIPLDGIDQTIDFYVPTLGITSKVFKHIVKTYKTNQSDKNRTEDKTIYDKQYLLFAPFLFDNPTQNMNDIRSKYNKIIKNPLLLQAYLDLATGLKFHNDDEVENECDKCGSTEETPIRFPGGIQKLFIGKSALSKYFGQNNV
jgi:hypothetical protein